MIALLRQIDRLVFLICKWGVILALVALFVLLMAGILTRTFPFVSIAGYDEIIELAVAWMVFLGAVALWRDGTLYRVMIIATSAPAPIRRIVEALIHLIMLVVALVMTIKGYEFARDSGETTPFLRLDKVYWYASVPVTGALMTIYSIVGLIRLLSGENRTFDDSSELIG